MNYHKLFDPKDYGGPEPNACVFPPDPRDGDVPEVADTRSGRVYVYHDDLVLALNVAMATNRPLLIAGKSGCGKSSLARNLARALKARYYEYVVTSRSRARDLLWHFDAVERLADAQLGREHVKKINAYVEPGPLWWIFDPKSAAARGLSKKPGKKDFAPAVDRLNQKLKTRRAVLLVDEIDKADPDFANNLLVPFGSYQFQVDDLPAKPEIRLTKGPESKSGGMEPQEDRTPLLIITTNDERTLPEAFERRCLFFQMGLPTPDALTQIARLTMGPDEDDFYNDVSTYIQEHFGPCSIPQYLDALRALTRICGKAPDRIEDSAMGDILKVVLNKERQSQ